jgi:hypothetical protein
MAFGSHELPVGVHVEPLLELAAADPVDVAVDPLPVVELLEPVGPLELDAADLMHSPAAA